MKAVRVLAAIVVALALQTTLARLVAGGVASVDLVLVAVVYVALTNGPVTGMLAGSAAGIVQDALSIGVIGVGGLAKSVVGFAVGALGQQFIVTAALPRLTMFLGATIAHAALFRGLYELLGQGGFSSSWLPVLVQAVANAAVGMTAFVVIESLPMVAERRRASRRTRH